MRKPNIPYILLAPEWSPTYNGYMRFPAPKNMEKMARPMVIIFDEGLFFINAFILRIEMGYIKEIYLKSMHYCGQYVN
jgi:hypothetical protein